MEQSERTVSFEIGNSGYLAEIIKSDTKKYIKITHTVFKGLQKSQSSIKINPTVLHNLIDILLEFKDVYFDNVPSDGWSFNALDQKELIRRYLTGVPLKELAIQFNAKVSYLESILRNHDIELVDPKLAGYSKANTYSKWEKFKNR